MIQIKKIDSDLAVILKQNDFINEERGTKLVTEFLNLVQKRKKITKNIYQKMFYLTSLLR